jgi:hypothetical protein
MPIIGTPIPVPIVAPVGLGMGYVVSPPITTTYDSPILSKMRAVAIKQAQLAVFQVQLFDPNTVLPVDLTQFGLSNGTIVTPSGTRPPIQFRFMEAMGALLVDATVQNIVDAQQGIIACQVPDAVTANTGVYLCESGIFNGAGQMVLSNTFYTLIDRGLFTTSSTANPQNAQIGPPTLGEIRLNLKDYPESNRLIDSFEFDVADVCEAMVLSIQYWNMTPPPLIISYNTTNFPWRYQWLDGITAHLYEAAAAYYRRNNLKHQAGGLAIADLDKEREYLQAWQIRYERWTKWVQMKKVELNVAEGFGTLSSDYSYGPSAWSVHGGY